MSILRTCYNQKSHESLNLIAIRDTRFDGFRGKMPSASISEPPNGSGNSFDNFKEVSKTSDSLGDKRESDLRKFIDAIAKVALSSEDVSSEKKESIGQSGAEADEILIPPDGGWGWVVCGAAFFSNFLADGLMYSTGYFPEPIISSFQDIKIDIKIATVSWVFSLMTGFYQLGAPFVGLLTLKMTFREVAIIGTIIASSSFIIAAALLQWRLSIYILYGMAICAGLGMSWLYVPSVIAVGFYFQKRRALATSIAVSGSGIGSIFWPGFVRMMITRLGWIKTYYVQGGLLLTIIAAALAYRPVKHTRLKVGNAEVPGGAEILKQLSSNARVISQLRMRSNLYFASRADMNGSRSRRSIAALRTNDSKGAVPEASRNSGESKYGKSRLDAIIESLPAIQENSTLKPTSDLLIAENDQYALKLVDPSFGAEKSEELQDQFVGSLENIKGSSGILYVGSRAVINNPIYYDDIFLDRYPSNKTKSRSRFHMGRSELEARGDFPVVLDKKTEAGDEGGIRGKIFQVRWINQVNILEKLFDCTLFSQNTFVAVTVAYFLISAALFIPYTFFPALARTKGYTTEDTLYYFITMGCANTLARVAFGFLADMPGMSPALLGVGAMITGALTYFIMTVLNKMWQYCLCAAICGCSFGFTTCLRSIILVEILGIEKLTNGFGLLCLVQGVASLMGLPLSGFLIDTFNINATYYFGGILFIIAGLIMIPVHFKLAKEKKKWELKVAS